MNHAARRTGARTDSHPLPELLDDERLGRGWAELLDDDEDDEGCGREELLEEELLDDMAFLQVEKRDRERK